MEDVFICDAVRTPFGKYKGSLSTIRPDDLGAIPIKSLVERNIFLDVNEIDDIILGCANQAGEDNRNVARMAALLSGLPKEITGTTINRLCGSGMDAIAIGARAIKAEEASVLICGGVESMSRAPYVMGKSESPFARNMKIEDSTMGWRFVNKKMKTMYGVDSMPETAENLAKIYNISREEQDLFAYNSQMKFARAADQNKFADELIPVKLLDRKNNEIVFTKDEHPRATELSTLAKLRSVVSENGTVTAGNASGINDGAAAILLASGKGVKKNRLNPKAKVICSAVGGVSPNVMGIGPVPAIKKVLKMSGLTLKDMDVIEINEAFAAQVISVSKEINLDINDERLNPNGGAIAIGHPLGASGVRLITTATHELRRRKGKYALCAMCIGVGQGIAMIIEAI